MQRVRGAARSESLQIARRVPGVGGDHLWVFLLIIKGIKKDACRLEMTWLEKSSAEAAAARRKTPVESRSHCIWPQGMRSLVWFVCLILQCLPCSTAKLRGRWWHSCCFCRYTLKSLQPLPPMCTSWIHILSAAVHFYFPVPNPTALFSCRYTVELR